MFLPDPSLRPLVISALILGLVVPGLNLVPVVIIPITLALVIFITGFRFSFSEFSQLSLRGLLLGYLARFFLFPIFVYLVLFQLSKSFAEAALVVALMPTGVMAASFAALHQASVAATVICLLISSALAPAVIPWAFVLLRVNEIQIPTQAVATTLLIVLVAPLILGIIFKATGVIPKSIDDVGQVVIKYLIAVTCMCVIAQHRDQLFMNPLAAVLNVLGMVVLYFSLYLFPRLYAPLRKLPYLLRTCTIASGYNNNILAVVVASLYFPQEIAVIVLTSIPAGIVVVACLDKLLPTNAIVESSP
jgi:predicted Na+-dependent transporter